MKILALESSAMTASAAVVTEKMTISEYTIDNKMTHSQTLLAMIDEMVKMAGIELKELDAIAVSGGPGSFTGLRIGSATAKGLGMALDIPIVHVPTIDALAYNIYGTQNLICPMLDARRTQVYSGVYENYDSFKIVKQQELYLIKDIIEYLNSQQKAVIFLGDGVDANIEYIQANITVPYLIAPLNLNRAKAASVGALAVRMYSEGKYCRPEEHVPEYLRQTQAERELKEKKKEG